jgi:hypothetical protein
LLPAVEPGDSRMDVDARAYLSFKARGTNHPWLWIPASQPE